MMRDALLSLAVLLLTIFFGFLNEKIGKKIREYKEYKKYRKIEKDFQRFQEEDYKRQKIS